MKQPVEYDYTAAKARMRKVEVARQKTLSEGVESFTEGADKLGLHYMTEISIDGECIGMLCATEGMEAIVSAYLRRSYKLKVVSLIRNGEE